VTTTESGASLTVELVDSQFAANDVGVATITDAPVDFRADSVLMQGHATSGMNLTNSGTAELSAITSVNNALGLVFNVQGSLRVERSRVQGNDGGVLMVVDPAAEARIHCSNIVGNASGLELAQGDAVDARFNYWGDPSGPTHPDNVGGTGDSVIDAANGGVGSVEYEPFLAGLAGDDDCPAVAPPRPVPALGPGALGFLALSLAALAGLAAHRGGSRPRRR